MNQSRKRALAAAFVVLLVLSPVGMVAGETLLSSFYATQGPIHVQADNGLEVIVTGNNNLQSGNPFTASSYNLSTETNGHMNVSSTGAGTVQVDQIEGTFSNVSSVDAVGITITMDPGDKAQASVGGDITDFAWRANPAVDDGTVDFTYSSSLGSGSITLNNVPINTEIAAIDANNNDVLAVATSDGSGQITFSSPDSGSHDVVLQTSSGDPVITNLSPADNKLLTSADVTFSADINDSDFPGEEVTVELTIDGTVEDTQTLTSNGTYSTTQTVSLGGSHDWNITATDAYGDATTSATRTITAPSNVTFREEHDPSIIVDSVTVEVTAYYDGNVDRRTVTDGNLSLTGFPVDEPIVIRATATNHTNRTAVIESIYEQQSFFMLNTTETNDYLVRFDLQDPTNQFPREDTVIFVERDLNVSGTLGWYTITGDDFGVQGVPTNLVRDERYRLRVKNLETGDAVVIGTYTAIQSETVTVTPVINIDIPESERDYYWEVNENESAQHILVEYTDDASQTQEIKVTIHERFNDSNVLVNNQSFNTNTLVYQKSLTNDQVNKSWTAELYIDRGDGFEHYRVPISPGGVSILPAGLDEVWIQGIGVFIVLISAMAFSILNQGVGAITTSLVGGLLWWIGVLDTITTGAAIVLAIAISIAYHYTQTQGVPG